MISKQTQDEIKYLNGRVAVKKERIAKLHRLGKIGKNADLISEYDLMVATAEKTIFAILESQSYMDAHQEQVILHANARNRMMAKGLKDSLCNSQVQIDVLNNSIKDDNEKITAFEKGGKTNTGGIV